MLSGRGLCDELITRPEEFYRLCCVIVCDLETSRMGSPYIYDISRLRVKIFTSTYKRFVKWGGVLVTENVSRSFQHCMCYATYLSVFGFQFDAQRVQQEQTPPWICNCVGFTCRDAGSFTVRAAAEQLHCSCLHSVVTVF